jgi:hypothetical protein
MRSQDRCQRCLSPSECLQTIEKWPKSSTQRYGMMIVVSGSPHRTGARSRAAAPVQSNELSFDAAQSDRGKQGATPAKQV